MIRDVVLKFAECDTPACDHQFPPDRMGCASVRFLFSEAAHAGWHCDENSQFCPQCSQPDDPEGAATDRAYAKEVDRQIGIDEPKPEPDKEF